MAKIYTGKDGRLLLDGIEQVKVTNWTLSGSLEMLETTSLGESQRSYAPGVQEFNGSATLLYYKDAAGRNDAGTALRKIIKTDGVSDGDTVTIRLRLVDGDTTSDIALTSYITSVSIGASVGEISSAQISFQATGALQAVTI
jgi:hypothetical protein